jgi:mannose-6-phosphate isomerase-like protein (cupin superfamily)
MSYVKKFDESACFSTEERCDINELLNHSHDPDCSIAQARVAPGVTTQLHAVKDTTERYVILQGEGEVFINHQSAVKVAYLDVVTIAAGVAQKIHNTGDDDLIFLCICTPRFEQKNYQKLSP